MSERAKARARGLFKRPGFLLRRLHQIYVAIYLQECERFGTTPVQSSVLQVLLLEPGIDQATLGVTIGIDRTTASTVLARLEKRGLVRREATDEDRRVRRAFLTPQGEAMVEEMQGALEAAHARLVAPLPAAERADFIRKLTRLVESNNDEGRTELRNL
ncbi:MULTISPECIES: MarR family winged helix-turn-helix transcriptional regulator [unclassified Xanthobacter]|uniref:MarR family winged helix-turn-helix transcriptional regulator n=1 Tax=unclassified Xanthobacter TaxID=2623496 RepID=UPI001EDDE59D